MTDPVYCYPPQFTVLRNKLTIRNADALASAERQFVVQRLLETVPAGNFDLVHLRAIHHHLFQDVFAWTGEIRTVEIRKGPSQFQPTRFIETGMADIHHRIVEAAYFRGLSPQEFAAAAGPILGDVNHVHQFREGNGRAQLQFLRQLAKGAGHRIDLTRIEREAWMEASRQSHLGDHSRMRRCIRHALA